MSTRGPSPDDDLAKIIICGGAIIGDMNKLMGFATGDLLDPAALAAFAQDIVFAQEEVEKLLARFTPVT